MQNIPLFTYCLKEPLRVYIYAEGGGGTWEWDRGWVVGMFCLSEVAATYSPNSFLVKTLPKPQLPILLISLLIILPYSTCFLVMAYLVVVCLLILLLYLQFAILLVC